MATWTSNAVDPIGLPPNSEYPSSPDTSSRSQLLRDANPAGQGDLLGLVKTRPGTDTYYLLLSTDDGATWSYIAASGGSPPPHDGNYLHDQCICQDTVNYDVHWVTVPQWATSARYHRIALAYGGDGHVNGWSWEAADQPGPALDTNSGAYQGKAEIQEIVDGSSNHILLIAGIDRPSETRTSRLLAARTSAGTTALAPTSASHWLKLDGSAGVSVLCAKNTDTGVDPDALLNLTGVHQDDNVHTMDCCAAQLDNGDLAVFLGPMYFNDPTGIGDIRRWRFTRSGVNWALDAAVNGAVAVDTAPDGYSKPCMGNCIGGASAWLTYFDHMGLHVGSVSAAGAWSADGVVQPDTWNGSQAHFVFGWTAIGRGQDGTLSIHYERNGIFGDYATKCKQFEGYFDGEAWQMTETSLLWRRSVGYDPATPGADGSTSWSPIRGAAGVGVYAYPYADWATGQPHYSIHSLQGLESAQVYEEAPADAATGATTASDAMAAVEARSDTGAGATTATDAQGFAESRSDSTASADVVSVSQSYTEAPADSGEGATTASAALAVVEAGPDNSTASDTATAFQAAQEARADSASAGDTAADSQAGQGQEAPSDAAAGATTEQDTQAALESRQDAAAGMTSVVDMVGSAGEVVETLSDEALATDLVSDITHGVGDFARIAAARRRTRIVIAHARA